MRKLIESILFLAAVLAIAAYTLKECGVPLW
jgi:hypothetical protein